MDWIAKLLSSLFSGGIGLFQGLTNYNSVQDTNAMNLKIARETNQSNVEQANLAYARSLPFNQVKNLTDAGMSRAAALQSLSGGGTYSAPTLSSARMDAPQMNLQGVMSAIERLGDIPSNVTQQEINKQTLEGLRIENENKIAEEKRKQELHDFNIWKFKYDKNTAEMLDTASQKVLNALIDSGKSIQDFKDFEDMITKLGLNKDTDIRNLNYIARQDLESAVRTKFDAERARQSQENANEAARDKHQAALDAHVKALDDLKNSEFGRTLTAKQWQHVEEQTKLLSAQYADYLEDMDNRDKERDLKKLRLSADRLRVEMEISREELQNSFNFEKDSSGRWIATPTQHVKQRAKDFWQYLGAVVGLDYAGELIRGMVMVSPK